MLRLKYVSRQTGSMSDRALERLVADAQRRNGELDITGVLVFFGGVFMQILEGPSEPVATVFARIQRDPRHENVLVIRRSEVQGRLFGGWSMKRLEIDPAMRREMAAVLSLIPSCAHGSEHAASRLYELDDAIWRVVGDRMRSATDPASVRRVS